MAAGAAGVVLVLVGLLFKAGAVPAHFWVPDAVQGSWVTSAAFLTTVPKLGAVLAVAAAARGTCPAEGVWPLLVAVLAAVEHDAWATSPRSPRTTYAACSAWSTISQVGYLLAVVAAVPGVRAGPADAAAVPGRRTP